MGIIVRGGWFTHIVDDCPCQKCAHVVCALRGKRSGGAVLATKETTATKQTAESSEETETKKKASSTTARKTSAKKTKATKGTTAAKTGEKTSRKTRPRRSRKRRSFLRTTSAKAMTRKILTSITLMRILTTSNPRTSMILKMPIPSRTTKTLTMRMTKTRKTKARPHRRLLSSPRKRVLMWFPTRMMKKRTSSRRQSEASCDCGRRHRRPGQDLLRSRFGRV